MKMNKILIILGILLSYQIRSDEYPTLPDPIKTPGEILNVDKYEICKPGYASATRNVTEKVKNKVFDSYFKNVQVKYSNFEIDHLISLQLGGSNDESNLWPQSYTTIPYNAHEKDRLENHLHSLVCKGTLSLEDAQNMIKSNWIDAYLKYMSN